MSGKADTSSAASAIWPGKTCSSKTHPSSCTTAMFCRKTGSRIRAGPVAKRYSSRSCQCSCSRVPRTSGERAACSRIVSGASSANRSADPMTADGHPVASCTSWTQRTSSSDLSSGQLAWT